VVNEAGEVGVFVIDAQREHVTAVADLAGERTLLHLRNQRDTAASFAVVRGLDPRISLRGALHCLPDRDGRAEPGHDNR
jgi:hypothetical protein